VNTFNELVVECPTAAEQKSATPILAPVQRKAISPASLLHDEQIHALIQQLFFGHEAAAVRHVGFAPMETSTSIATLCLEIATALAEEDRYDVGLIDACLDSPLLQMQLQIPSPNRAETTWLIAPRLWMVPRQSWLPDASAAARITDQNLSRLRELTAEFDFSILYCAPVSWITASICQACDGLVLVLTANKTRRLVAAQIKDQLAKARVPLLGTVLAERRFPVPQGLYQNL
jgi:hypothetical protein